MARHGRREPHWRRRGIEVLLAVASVIGTVGAIEVAARWLRPSPFLPPAMYRPAPDVAYELRPGFVGRGPAGEAIRINAAGLRGPDLRGKQPQATRVVAVGDSFTFGLGVGENETWPAHARDALHAMSACRANQAGGEPVRPANGTSTCEAELLNAGVPGYNLFQVTRWLEHRASALAPDVVVIGFVENDVYNLDGSDFEATPDGRLVPRPDAFQPDGTINPFAALSGPLLWLQLHSTAFREASFLAIRARLAARGDAELGAIAALAEQSATLPARLLRGEHDADTTPRWQRARQLLGEASAAGRRLGAPLFLVLLPRPEQIVSARLQRGFEVIAGAARAAGIEVIDPMGALATDSNRIGLFLFPRDHHPSGRAYETIGRTVAGALVDHLTRLDGDPR